MMILRRVTLFPFHDLGGGGCEKFPTKMTSSIGNENMLLDALIIPVLSEWAQTHSRHPPRSRSPHSHSPHTLSPHSRVER